MQIVVLGCEDCYLYVNGYCNHPLHKKEAVIGECDNGTPDFCPLNKEPLIITKPTNTKTQIYMTIKPEENEQWRYM